ncbi:MAG: membrane dipeptidase, partial [Sandaracinaceae bacterium]|nr:membrane dipeptidase [Sandaracinaceae bacterium]
MSARRVASLVLALALSACGSTSTDTTTSTAPAPPIANSRENQGDRAIDEPPTAAAEAPRGEERVGHAETGHAETEHAATEHDERPVETEHDEHEAVHEVGGEAAGDEVAHAPTDAEPTTELDAQLETDVIVAIDTHADTTQRLLDEHADLSTRLSDGHLDLPRMREGGLTAVFLSIWVDPRRYRGEAAWDRSRALVAAVRAFVAAHPDEVVLAPAAAEVRAAAAQHRIAFLMGLEGAHGLGEAEPAVLLSRLDELAASGVRYVTITWTNDNVFGHASTGAHPGRGLTDAGRELVAHMNALGVIVDVSHVSDRTALDAIEVARAPVLASHSGARAIGDHPRNLPDAILRRIAKTHGAVCLNYY